MPYFEVLSVLLTCLAVVVMSLAAWTGQRKFQREANDIQRATAELAKKQLELLLREEKGKNSIRLSLSFERENKGIALL